MRAVILLASIGCAIGSAIGCTIGESRPPVLVQPKPDPDRMPSSVLDHQDPAADTSHNPVLWQSGSRASPLVDQTLGQAVGCLRLFTCDAGTGRDAGRGRDLSGLFIVGAVLAATRRRRTAKWRIAFRARAPVAPRAPVTPQS